MKIKEIYDFLDFIAPFDTSAEWDNCGLAVGSLDNEVTKVLIALDVTDGVIEKAIETGAELVITHHPLLFNSVSQITADSILYKAVKSGITFISSHTCLDKAISGVNYALARKVGIKNIRNSDIDEFLKIGEIEPCEANEFAQRIKNALGGSVAFTERTKSIKTVALCSGSGGDLIEAAAKEGADALLTGEAKHHEFLAAKHLGVSLFVAGHYETEVVVCEFLRNVIGNQFDCLRAEVYEEQDFINYL